MQGRTVRDMWLVYALNRFVPHGIDLKDPAFRSIAEVSFYAGATSMFELTMRMAPNEISEEAAMEMLTRLREELEQYGKGEH